MINLLAASFVLATGRAMLDLSLILPPPASQRLHAKRVGSYLSPDHRYRASLLHGEAEAVFLRVYRSGHETSGPLVEEMDVTGAIWDPRRPHFLLYCESAMYGSGKIAVWNGGKERVAWHGNYIISNLTWDLGRNSVEFSIMDSELHWKRKKWRRVSLKGVMGDGRWRRGGGFRRSTREFGEITTTFPSELGG